MFIRHREHAERARKGMKLMVLPLYGGLPYSEQVGLSPIMAAHFTLTLSLSLIHIHILS